jgi:hypothetical protein
MFWKLKRPDSFLKGILVLVVFSFSLAAGKDSVNAAFAGDLKSGAVVLVNHLSPSYPDFQHFIQPYLDHFGVPYTILDIASQAVGLDIGDVALIIVGHSQLDPNLNRLDAAEQAYISAAVSAGTGLVNFDNDLSSGGLFRYQYIQDIFGFDYTSPVSGSGVTFTSVGGDLGIKINCQDDSHQDPVLETFTNPALFDDEDGKWDEFLWEGYRDYAGVFGGLSEASSGNLETIHFYADVPNGTYQLVANLYHSRELRYYWGYTPGAPRAYSIDVDSGPSGDFSEFELGTIEVSNSHFNLYTDYGEDLGGTSFAYFGWAWIRLIPIDTTWPEMHYITMRHDAGETISTGSMTMAGISLPEDVVGLAKTVSQPFLAVTTHGLGNAVQWGTYNWMSNTVKGPVYGFDDLVWRSIVWAARKPFVMQGTPNFVTMRVDDESGPFGWIEIANEFGLKPWTGLFYYDIDPFEAAHLSTLVNSGNATASIHAKSEAFFYYNHGIGDFSDAIIADNFSEATSWHLNNHIPISKFVLPHFYEFGTNVFQGLLDWGVEFVGTLMDPGSNYSAPWVMNGPYRLYETGSSSEVRPLYYADFLSIPGHPEFDGKFFNCVAEIRDDAGYEWYPDNDVQDSIGRGTRQTERSLDSMALSTLFTHGYYVDSITSENWRAILQGITANLAPYNPIYVTLDYACQYLRAMHTSDIVSSSYDPNTRQMTITLEGETDMPTMFYLFTEQGDDIHQVMVDVPAFSGLSEVAYTLAGPLDHIVVTPASAIVVVGGKQQFTALGYDIDNNPIPNLPFTWNVVNGGGTIDTSGIFTAGVVEGTYHDSVEASISGITGYASVEVVVPTLDHFSFEPIGGPIYVDTLFQVTIAARDVSENLVTGYSGQVNLNDSTGTIEPLTSGSFSAGLWTGELKIGQAAHEVTITASDGGAIGTSQSFEVLLPDLFYQVTSPSYQHLKGEAFLVTVATSADLMIDLWENDHQDQVSVTTTRMSSLEISGGQPTESLSTPSPSSPAMIAGHNGWEQDSLGLMHFFASDIPNGVYEVWADLYPKRQTRQYYGFTQAEVMTQSRWVDNMAGEGGSGQYNHFSLGLIEITDGSFNLWVGDGDIREGLPPDVYDWASIRLALAGITMSSNSQTMLFDADGDGIFGELGDNFKFLVGNAFDIMARDTAAGNGVTIVATDKQGRLGYNTYTILSAVYLPVLFASGPPLGD